LDTTIIDDADGEGLQLETSYVYYAVRIDSANAEKDSSAFITAQTLGATSHDYTWEEITIGDDGYSNALYDVWGTDENNVYAVGGFNINGTNYGVYHWDGNTWTPIADAGGYAIFVFSENDIWVAGGEVFHFDGNRWSMITDNVIRNNIEYRAVWGTSSENMYFGNIWGKIVHWDGSRGSLEEVPTEINIKDIYGISAENIRAAGNGFWLPGIAYRYNGLNWEIVSGIDYDNISLESVYMRNSKEIYYAGSGIIEYFGSSVRHISNLTNKSLYCIRGRKETPDMLGVGYEEILHFNGIDWKSYRSELNLSDKKYFGVFFSGKTVFIVGKSYTNSKGIILIGRK
jgi:hypothetical protein